MKNTFGTHVSVTLFGESHGEEIGAVLDGMMPGIPVDPDTIASALARRRPQSDLSTARVEPDQFRIVSGVRDGVTTGAPLCMLIPNRAADPSAYTEDVPRPGHADLSARAKYHGYEDRSGGGHFSGRLTAPLVAVGAIAETALAMCGVQISSHILSVGDVSDRHFEDYAADFDYLGGTDFPVLDPQAAERMKNAIRLVRDEGDSIGGIAELAVTDFPAGVGEPWFDTVEGILSHAFFSIPAVKGVEFGDGFALATQKGSEANDQIRLAGKELFTTTNHSGGINGGITNGMPIVARIAVKPTPSIAKEQESVDLSAMTPCTLSVKGRHDPCILPRVIPVFNAVTALTLCDLLSGRYGTDFVGKF